LKTKFILFLKTFLYHITWNLKFLSKISPKKIITKYKILNKSYDQKTTDINQFDFKSAQKLYENLDDLQKEVSDKFSLILERIRKVKVNIMNALIKGDFEEISDLAKKALELKLNAASIFNIS